MEELSDGTESEPDENEVSDEEIDFLPQPPHPLQLQKLLSKTSNCRTEIRLTKLGIR
jgi:hypothetical protein